METKMVLRSASCCQPRDGGGEIGVRDTRVPGELGEPVVGHDLAPGQPGDRDHRGRVGEGRALAPVVDGDLGATDRRAEPRVHLPLAEALPLDPVVEGAARVPLAVHAVSVKPRLPIIKAQPHRPVSEASLSLRPAYVVNTPMKKVPEPAATAQPAISPEYDIRAEIGPRLLMVRKLIDDNRTRIANQYGVSHVRWRGWETGEYYPDAGVIAAFCRDYGVTMDWLYLGRLETLPESTKVLLYLAHPDLQQQVVAKAGDEKAEFLRPTQRRAVVPAAPATGRRRRGRRLERENE